MSQRVLRFLAHKKYNRVNKTKEITQIREEWKPYIVIFRFSFWTTTPLFYFNNFTLFLLHTILVTEFIQKLDQYSLKFMQERKRFIKKCKQEDTNVMESIFSSKNSEYSWVCVRSSSNLVNWLSFKWGASWVTTCSASSSFTRSFISISSSFAMVPDIREESPFFASRGWSMSSSILTLIFSSQIPFILD